MELVKDIYFNTDKLVENTKVKVSYTGNFYQGNNDKVYIHYGYGENWNNTNEAEMIKTDLGYQTELELVGGNTLNFCFKNQNNEWDNNFGKNYIFNIEKASINQPENANDGFNIINPVLDNCNSVATPVAEISPIKSEIINNIQPNKYGKYGEITTNAIAVVNTGFQKTMVWTRKLKVDVCKFFAEVPKFISANYKRIIDNKKQ